MGCCHSGIQIGADIEISGILKERIGGAMTAIEDQTNNVRKAKDKITEHVKAVDGKVGSFIQENVKDRAAALEGNINDIKNQALALEEKVSSFVKENVQQTLEAIKDLKLKQRVSDIICPIFRKCFVHSIHGSIEDTYEIKDILGQGSFSVVRQAHHYESSHERAIKIITKNSVGEDQLLSVQNETEMLKALDHPNIIRIIEIVEDNTKINIVTDLCEGGELFDRIINCKSFSENLAANYMFQILSGLIHIHNKGFIHRDMKPENILFVANDEAYLKIIDFGISLMKDSGKKSAKCFGSVSTI